MTLSVFSVVSILIFSDSMFVANISVSNEGLERFICHLANGGGAFGSASDRASHSVLLPLREMHTNVSCLKSVPSSV